MSSQQRKLARSYASSGGSEVLPGNGAPVTRKVVVRPDGTTVTQMGIEIGNLPPPERRYSADEARVKFNGIDAVHLIFTQHTINGPPRSLVAVKMYCDSAKRFTETLVPLKPVLEAFAIKHSIPPVPAPAELPDEPAQSVSLVASFAQAAISGWEAEMSFFHVSPYAIHRAGQGTSGFISVEPVVQIDLSTGALHSVILQLEGVVGGLPAGADE